MVACTLNPGTWVEEAAGSLQVPGQSGLQSEISPKKKKKKKKEKILKNKELM